MLRAAAASSAVSAGRELAERSGRGGEGGVGAEPCWWVRLPGASGRQLRFAGFSRVARSSARVRDHPGLTSSAAARGHAGRVSAHRH